MKPTGTQKKQGNDTGPAPGHQALDADDVAPRRSRARIGLLALLLLIIVILVMAFFLAGEAPETVEDPPIVLDDSGDTLGN